MADLSRPQGKYPPNPSHHAFPRPLALVLKSPLRFDVMQQVLVCLAPIVLPFKSNVAFRRQSGRKSKMQLVDRIARTRIGMHHNEMPDGARSVASTSPPAVTLMPTMQIMPTRAEAD